VDAFITDTYDPRTGRRGATGLTHDWSISATLVQLLDRPLWLAGGLTADNVADGVRATRPAGVDAHTGVEDPRTGRKDPARMRAFVANAVASAVAAGG
jgi:phosphoribosylanthranilate isomerase